MSQYYKQISQYFRQSLIDADRLCPDDKDILRVLGLGKQQTPEGDYLALTAHHWLTGSIDTKLAEQILDTRQPPNKPVLQQLEIVIFPRVDFLKYSGGESDKRKRSVMLPLVIFASLDRDGRLTPTNKGPWVPRVWIGPTQSASQPFTEMALLDEFFTLHPFEGVENWSQLVAYCSRLLCHATGTPYREASEQTLATEVSEIAISSDYDQSIQCLLQLTPPVIGAKKNLLKTLDFIIEKAKFPLLYQVYSNRQNTKLLQYREQQDIKFLAKQHVGQMSGEFPLSVKQRNGLHYFIEQKNGEVLAINGPPGTGKTTLLRSVVANLWTKAAIDQTEPPLIVATSNNNQPVTNILESFARIDETGLDDKLTGRWLPQVDSYGLYFCAGSKANKQNLYRYSGPNNEGCMEEWQTQTFVTEAQEYFLIKASAWKGSEFKNVDAVMSAVHEEMLITQNQIKLGGEYLAAWQVALENVDKKYGSFESLENFIKENKVTLTEALKTYEKEKALLDALYELWESRSLWVTLLMWLPPVSKHERRKSARLLNQWNRTLKSLSDEDIEDALKQQLIVISDRTNQIQRQLVIAEKHLSNVENLTCILNNWLAPSTNLKLFSKSMPDKVDELNDRFYRFRLFKLATHYFEARWLIETKTFVETNDSDKKSPLKLLRKLRRYAKLTPCFVSTFYMVPSALMAGEYKDGNWMDLPQLEEIDLLIVDEAGQALPDISSASFALAKRALIVGDTDQIEPVWNISASVDRSNLTLFGLLESEEDYQKWLDSGLLASSGNVMRLAQRQCNYHQFEQLQRGLYLTEHRRCFNSIVDYCNDLVYQGVLEPLRGNAKHDVPWGTMSLLPVYSTSQSFGGSRGNPGEAKAIAQWLLAQAQTIVTYARQQDTKYCDLDDAKVLNQTVGIVTPFSKQAKLISSELVKVGIKGLTVGTVHSLQGDERLVVLFSSVYGDNNKDSGKFYDRGPNMLNVAVSRAKDAFIVFGDPNIFGTSAAGSPSGLLRKRLKIMEFNAPSLESEELLELG